MDTTGGASLRISRICVYNHDSNIINIISYESRIRCVMKNIGVFTSPIFFRIFYIAYSERDTIKSGGDV